MELRPGPEATLEGCHAAALAQTLRVAKVSHTSLNDLKSKKHYKINLELTVEGTWDIWSSWGACSTTCDSTGIWSRSRSHTGNMPCIGSNTETAGCQSEISITAALI